MVGKQRTRVHKFWQNESTPPRKMIVHWILDSWHKLNEEIIVNPFKAYALNLNVGGSEYGNIHCFKKNGLCQEG